MSQVTLEARKVVRKDNIAGGVPILEGTRIRVSDIVVFSEHHGLSPEEITRELLSITIADVYSALTYYYEHPREIREEIAQRLKIFEQAKRSHDGRSAV